MTRQKFGQGWYHHAGQWHIDHDKGYERFELPLESFQQLNCNLRVYKAVCDALYTFCRDKRLFWNNFMIKTHSGSDFHIIRPRVSLALEPRSSWRLIVALFPDTGLVDVLIVSPVRDYDTINQQIQDILKEGS